MSRTRVLLADDHAILRSGLRLLLERESDVEDLGGFRVRSAPGHGTTLHVELPL